ncbi:MAG TPA: secretin and TonB N-terminal domain-containing protein [Thiobacillaceae bacterium]|nr:secretin and TonB N-terminal domain-containing protein [Thiobacillaceae bacterium]
MKPTPPSHPVRGAILALAAVLLAGCATDAALREGERLIAEGQPEAGLKQLEQAMREHPDELRTRTAYITHRDRHIAALLQQADALLRAGQPEAAEARYRAVLELHPQNPRAPAGLAAVQIARRNQELLAAAEAALNRNEPEAARIKLRAILAQTPDHAQAETLLKRLEEKARRATGIEPPQLGEAYRKQVSLEFREAPMRSVFDAVSRQTGLNFVFDKDVRADQRATVSARNTPIAEALDMILGSNGLARKVLNANTLMIYPNLPAKQREYEEVAVRSFFLANADAKQVMTMLKSIAKIRDVYVDEKLNMVMARDTPETLRLAEKLVAVADRPEPEVMLEVEILEVSRGKLLELGVQWPTQLSVLNVEQTTPTSVITDTTGATTATNTIRQLPLNIRTVRNQGWGDLGVSPNPLLNLRSEDGDVNLLANPRIRVKNKEKAKIHIGDKVPVITSNVTSTGVTSESVSYLDVGLKLDVEPQVMLDGDVAMKVGLEVSNIVQQVKTATGTLTYQLGSRNATTSLRLRDGETQVLAGLISDQDRSSASKVPGLGDLPLIGRLFSSNRDEKNKTEIVLLITPRVLRNVERPELAEAEFLAGTEAAVSAQPLRLRPAVGLPGRPPVDLPEPVPQELPAPVQEPQIPPFVPQPPVAAPPPAQ